MKKIASMVLVLFCTCFVFAQEKELPQTEIQKMYIDYFHEEIEKVVGLTPAEKDNLYACADSAVKKYQVIPDRGNNTLRKFQYVRKNFPLDRMFSEHKELEKFNTEKKQMYMKLMQKSIDFMTQMFLSKKLIDEEKRKAMDIALMNFEKEINEAMMKMLKRDRNFTTDIQRSKQWIRENRERMSTDILFWVTDSSYAKIKWKQLNRVNYSFFEKNRTLLLPTTPFTFLLLLEKRIDFDYQKMQDEVHVQNAQNMELTLSEYMEKIKEIQELYNNINNNNNQAM